MANDFAWALRTGKFSVEKVCTTCVFAKEYGDTTGADEDWDEARFTETLNTYEATMGHPHESEWFTDCHHDGERCPDDADCDCERDSYSTTECGMCGSTLGGERHDFIFIHWNTLGGNVGEAL